MSETNTILPDNSNDRDVFVGLLTGTLKSYIDDEIMSIPNGVAPFKGTKVEYVSLPSLTRLGEKVFSQCESVREIRLQSCTFAGNDAFSYSRNLTSVYAPNVEDGLYSGFYGCTALENVTLPKLKKLQYSAFASCGSLRHITLQSVEELVGGYQFSWSDKLESVALPSLMSIPNAIGNAPFNGCSALLDIYLPGPESSYVGAPWGATNATVHYNTTFDENGEPVT